ncbi:uncharacterized protein LOC135837043 isoform X4 [Planococcus citri]|uniref:uncharacterized protein LOC135837043 isoform X4 n=1 Tax=Planococcus citri TaxID=170843 RepID=UPI0031F7F446
MHPTRKIFVFLLLIYLNGFGFFQSSLVSAGPVFDLYAESVRKLIEATTLVKVPKPLTFFTAAAETALVNLTKHSIDLKLISPVTVATMTGGIFGHDLYELYKYQLFWNKDTCNITHNLDAAVYYFNLKYGSYEKALEHPGGVVVITIPIATTGDFPNPTFDVFAKIIQANIHWPGSWTKAPSVATYTCLRVRSARLRVLRGNL